MKKIPMINYIIALIITVITFALTYVIANTYISYRNYEQENYMNYLSQVMPEEIDNYIIENHDLIVYVTNSATTDIEIEKKVKKVLVDNDYVKDTVYLDLSNVDPNFLVDFENKYNINPDTLKENDIIIFKEEKKVRTINITENSIKKLKNYIVTYYGE